MELIENEKKILAFIRQHGKTSKMALAGENGIQCAWATISKLVNRLEKNGLITKAGTDGIPRRYGKNAYLYDLNENSHITLGVDVEKSTTSCHFLTLGGDPLKELKFETPASLNYNSLLEFLLITIKSCLEQSGLSTEQILGVGIGMPAQDLQLQQKTYAHIAREIADQIGIHTVANNNIHAYTDYYNLNRNDVANFYMIAIRTGVGGGFVVDHRLYHGLHFAGEIGHIPNPLKQSDREEVLENVISLPALKAWYQNQFQQACPDTKQWGSLLDQNDPNISALIHHVLDHLIPTFELLIKILDVPKIIVASTWEVSQDRMNQLLKEKGFRWENRVLFENFDTDQFVSASAFLVQKPLFL